MTFSFQVHYGLLWSIGQRQHGSIRRRSSTSSSFERSSYAKRTNQVRNPRGVLVSKAHTADDASLSSRSPSTKRRELPETCQSTRQRCRGFRRVLTLAAFVAATFRRGDTQYFAAATTFEPVPNFCGRRFSGKRIRAQTPGRSYLRHRCNRRIG